MQSVLEETVKLCQLAGDAILEVYHRTENIKVNTKTDNSPVTEADLAAHQILVSALNSVIEGVPILSEEGDIPDAQCRARWQRYWLIDPLDGTREFIKRNGQFTVNVALIDKGIPILGVVHVPVQGITYAGTQDLGAFKIGPHGRQAIKVRTVEQAKARGQVEVVVSRAYGAASVIAQLEKNAPLLGPITSKDIGSSLKLCLVAEGSADLYPRQAPTNEWDTAAAQAIVEAAGGIVVDDQFSPLRYNQKESLLNPYFHVIGDKHFDWESILKN